MIWHSDFLDLYLYIYVLYKYYIIVKFRVFKILLLNVVNRLQRNFNTIYKSNKIKKKP